MFPVFQERLWEYVKSKGYQVFEKGDYNLNLFGIRTGGRVSVGFDDSLVVCYKKEGEWTSEQFSMTTDPGGYWLANPMNKKGTAILKEGQYLSSWKLGRHKGLYRALVQCKPVTVYRDENRDSYLDMGKNEETGNFGINIHRAGTKKRSVVVGRWSAGCQVLSDPLKYKFFLSLCKEQIRNGHGNRFTYTVLDRYDFERFDKKLWEKWQEKKV